MTDCSADCFVVSHLPPATASVLNKGQSLLFANSSGRGAISKNIVGRRNSTEDAFDLNFPSVGYECTCPHNLFGKLPVRPPSKTQLQGHDLKQE